MQEIPGYYFDPVKNRYFKIMSSGPHSLAAIRKAQHEADRSTTNKNKNITTRQQRSNLPPLPNTICDQNVIAYLRSRRICTKLSRRNLINNDTISNTINNRMIASTAPAATKNRTNMNTTTLMGTRALYKNLRPTNQLNIPGSPLSRACSMDFHGGDAVICYPQGCPMRFKYQCDPFFTMWNTQFPAHVSADVTNIHLGRQLVRYRDDEYRRPVYGSTELCSEDSKATLWRVSMPSVAEMDQELATFLRDQHTNTITNENRNVPVVLDGSTNNSQDRRAITMDCTFSLKRNNFWTCSVNDNDNSLVVGCDTGAFMLTSTFNVLGRSTSRTAVLASSIIPERPGIAWLGCRDSEVKLFDPRMHSQQQLRFKHSRLAVSDLEALDAYRLLAVDVGESVAIWDIRYISSKNNNNNIYNKRCRPIQRLKGHVNTGGTRVAVDVDKKGQLLALAGNDHRVRLWSLADSHIQGEQSTPFWESKIFTSGNDEEGPVQAVKFIDDPPPMVKVWNKLPMMPKDRQNQAPGLVVAAPVNNMTNTSSVSSRTISSGIHWFTI
ncbi:hypothetical protein BDC45DRAFT_520012 [Circinella umbellata]|nr:hypothetical protein BDC45DRAFT_520012 [Circinella umbellata]